MFKNVDVNKYTWVELSFEAVVEIVLMDVMLVVGSLLDVRGCREEVGGRIKDLRI